MDKAPIEDLKEIVKFGLGLGNAFGKSLSDGKVSLSDLANFVVPLKDAVPAFVGMSNAKDVLLSMSEEQHKELIDFAKVEFDLENDDIEVKVEGAIDLALHIFRYVMLFVKKSSPVEGGVQVEAPTL
jgi:hypothetical protein